MAKAMKKAAAAAPATGQWMEVYGWLKLGQWNCWQIMLKAAKKPAMKDSKEAMKKAAKKPAMKDSKEAMKKAAKLPAMKKAAKKTAMKKTAKKQTKKK